MASRRRLHDLIQRVRPLYRTLHRAVEAGLAGTGITVAERAVLERLHAGGAQTVPELAAALDLERQPVQRSVDRLAGAGLVERAENPRSRKSHRIALTGAGERTIAGVLAREGEVIRRVARGLDAAALESCIEVIDHVIAGFAAGPRSAA